MNSRATTLSLFLASLATPVAAQCPGWVDTFGSAGTVGDVLDLAAWDDGSGSNLYVAGRLTAAGGAPAGRIARWNGSGFDPLGSGLNGSVMAVLPIANGFFAGLHVAGAFTTAGGTSAYRVARWDGAAWSALGSGMNGDVNALSLFDDGSGPAVYAGGVFTVAGGVDALFIARWNGTTWSPVGAGLDGPVDSLTNFDDGSGMKLWAGGSFGSHVASWDGAQWSASPGAPDGRVLALCAYDDGSGLKLHAGGSFLTAAGVSARGLARLDSTGWYEVGGGVSGGSPASVRALTVADDGSGPALFVGGSFTTCGTVPVGNVARWDGVGWSALSSGTDGAVEALLPDPVGGGPGLLLGGGFAHANEGTVEHVARWRAPEFSGLGPGGLDGEVQGLAVADLGAGPELYVGGRFQRTSTSVVNRIARWDGQRWHALGSGLAGSDPFFVRAIAEFDSGSGSELYVGGRFTLAGGVPVQNIARWNGASWSDVGGGVQSAPGFPTCVVNALYVWDDGTGPALYAGGHFLSAGGAPAPWVAKWNGSSWASLGAGLNGDVYTLQAFDDGTGEKLYVGGHFNHPQGLPTRNIARWNGQAWGSCRGDHVCEPRFLGVGGSVRRIPRGSRRSAGPGIQWELQLHRWDDGVLRRRDPSHDRHCLTGLGLSGYPAAHALAVFDDGSGLGPALCVPRSTSGVTTSILRRRDSTWETFATVAGRGNALATFQTNPSNRALFVGGLFSSIDGVAALHIAAFEACDSTGTLFCLGDGSGTACPCGNASAAVERAGCTNSLGLAASLRTSGLARLTQDTLVLHGASMPDATCLYLQGSQRENGGAGSVFGDGLRCVGGAIVRLGVKTNSAGASSYPEAADPALHVRGSVLAPGGRAYQVWYRNGAAFCTPSAFNLTNGVDVTWEP